MPENIIQPHEARVNITYAGANGDLPDPVSFDATDGDVRAMLTEALRGGGVPGIPAQADADLRDFVVDRFASTAEVPYNRLMVRPKTPFGMSEAAPSAEPAKPRQSIKLLYAAGERGWAVDLGDGTARIDNLPLAEGLNIDDVVRVVAKNGDLVVGERVSRAWTQKTGIQYPAPHKETWAKLVPLFSNTTVYKLEGFLPGRAFVAHNGTAEKVRALAREAGVELEDAQDLLDVGLEDLADVGKHGG